MSNTPSLSPDQSSGVFFKSSYASIEQADIYCAQNNYISWSALEDTAKQAALMQATYYLDGNYTFVGKIALPNQERLWPRIGFDNIGRTLNGIPAAIIIACAELAFEHILEPLDKRLTKDDYKSQHSESVDVIQESTHYRSDAPVSNQYPRVDALLRPYVARRSLFNTKKLIRS